ncbi:flagellar motor switch protein FliN [Gammaproteobacteria bacterium 45_16_T64]|nr:flagellar motor switch protein FliN [Gammaproteobacteria bacterium 45_16_T64]
MSDSEEPKEDIDDAALADEWAAALEQQETEEDVPAVTTAPLDDLMAQAEAAPSGIPVSGADNPNLDVILDIPVRLTMEVGSTNINIRNLLQLNQGSVIELDRLAGEPLDVLVNGTLIAHGEVVVVNEKFGIRLTDVISPNERIKKLG